MDHLRVGTPPHRKAWPCYAFVVSHMATAVALVGIPIGIGNRAFGEDASVVLRFTLRGHSSHISSVAFSPDSKTLASAGPHIKLWNPATGDELATLKTANTSHNFIRYSADGRTLVSARGDGEVVLWDVASGEHSTLLRDPSGATNAAVSRQGTTLAVIMNWQNPYVDIWDFSSKERLKTIEGIGDDTAARQFPGAIQFSPDAKILATAHGEGKIKLWDVMDARRIKTITAYKPEYVVPSVAFSPDGKTLAAGAGGNTDDTYLSACEATLWDVESGKKKASFVGNKYGIGDVAISPDGRLIATGGHDSTVRLWDIATQKPIATLKGHRKAVVTIAFSHDGRLLASGSGDRTVRVWELPLMKGKTSPE